MFTEKSRWGDHEIYKYDMEKHPFVTFFNKLFNEKNLQNLHLQSNDFNELKDCLELGHLNDRDTDLHQIFYKEIKTNDTFKKLYCLFIKDLHSHFFPEEEIIMYQSYPSVRFQYMESVTIPPHKDSDHLSNHPIGEKNFLIPITEMVNTNSIFIESSPDKKDFKSIHLKPGELFYFNGNTCTHFNKKNKENKLRISLDFRIILKKDYVKYINSNNIISSNPRDVFWKRPPKKMLAGGYYQITTLNEPLNDMIKWHDSNHFIMQHRPTFDKKEADACYQYMMEDNFVTEYKKTQELENIISTYLKCKYCFMTTSGTSALLLALMALDLHDGDEVIVPNYTMIATVNAIKMLKLKPVICDVNKDTFTISCDEIRKNLSKKTKCVMHVSLNNRQQNIQDIVDLCKANDIFLIEDSAQSMGCKVNDKYFGTFGDIGCFSLSSPKIISTGQGGYLITNSDALADKIRMTKNFGRKESGKDNFETFGLNFKFTDLQAVVGIEQMKKLDYRKYRLKDMYRLYYDNLKSHFKMIKPMDDYWFPWFIDIIVDKRDYIVDFLKKHNIQTRPVYKEINKTNIYYSDKTLPNSNHICNNGLFLPSYITLTNDEILHICKILKICI
jgi:perosamine synthetase